MEPVTNAKDAYEAASETTSWLVQRAHAWGWETVASRADTEEDGLAMLARRVEADPRWRYRLLRQTVISAVYQPPAKGD